MGPNSPSCSVPPVVVGQVPPETAGTHWLSAKTTIKPWNDGQVVKIRSATSTTIVWCEVHVKCSSNDRQNAEVVEVPVG